MEEELTGLLKADPALAALVGDRIDWDERVQASSLPAVVLSVAGGRGRFVKTEGADNIVETRVQVDSWGATATSALHVDRAVDNLLSGQSRRDAQTPVLGIFPASGVRSSTEGEKPDRIFRRSRDFLVWHRVPAA